MVSIANMVSTADELRVWSAHAKPREFVTYHIGNLAADRMGNAKLHELANMVNLLQEFGWLMQSTRRVKLASIEGFAYYATRTGAGSVPRSVLMGTITPPVWLALQAVRDRGAYQSAHRAIRDKLSTSEDAAADTLAWLWAQGWVEEAPEKGYRLSDAGAMAML